MTWLVSFSVALLSGLAGILLTGFIANACVAWYQVTSREGAAGFFVVFTSLGGGIAGLVVGLIVARFVAWQIGPGFGKELAGALGVVMLVAGVAAMVCRALADVAPQIDGRDLNLEVEFRFPDRFDRKQSPEADEHDWRFSLAALAGQTRRTWREGEMLGEAARFENGQWIVPAKVHLFTERGKRNVLLVRQEVKEDYNWLLPLPPRPGVEFEEWSDWIPQQLAAGAPWPTNAISCRFRVQKIPLPPPPQSQADWKAEQDAKQEAAFTSIPADAPVQAWFPYLDYEQPQTERALQLVAGRPNLAMELGQIAVGEDAELAGKALRCIEKLPAVTAEFIAPVEAAGRDLIERIRQVNLTTVEADPGYEGAANVSIRFNGWMSAVRVLHEKCDGNFTPELKSILELSRVRPESHCMRQDICRVASYYLHQWAGIAPLPTDPKPR